MKKKEFIEKKNKKKQQFFETKERGEIERENLNIINLYSGRKREVVKKYVRILFPRIVEAFFREIKKKKEIKEQRAEIIFTGKIQVCFFLEIQTKYTINDIEVLPLLKRVKRGIEGYSERDKGRETKTQIRHI